VNVINPYFRDPDYDPNFSQNVTHVFLVSTRVGRGLDSSMDLIGSDWIGLILENLGLDWDITVVPGILFYVTDAPTGLSKTESCLL